jgi:hypothetical protein
MVHEQGTYHLRLEQHDALLFRAMPDGTMGMRVLSLQEWEDRVSQFRPGPWADEADVVRQIFLEVTEVDSVSELAGSPRAR